jgi:hypothetical protein
MGSPNAKQELITQHIYLLRGQKVMLDADLARLYGVPTGALVQAVKRNRARFPSDFFFQLTKQDVANLKSQSVISSLPDGEGWGGRRAPVNAFTEQGVAMLSSVLGSPRAISVNIAIMRTFVQLRSIAWANERLAKKLDKLERRVAGHDEEISGIIRAIRTLATPPSPGPKRRIGSSFRNKQGSIAQG